MIGRKQSTVPFTSEAEVTKRRLHRQCVFRSHGFSLACIVCGNCTANKTDCLQSVIYLSNYYVQAIEQMSLISAAADGDLQASG